MGAVHSRASRAAGGRLVGIAASTPASALRAAGALGIEQAYDSFEALLAEGAPDIVHICTPNTTHAGLAQAAIDAGAHVICEKPLATSVEAAEHLVAEANRAGVTATVPFVYRYHPMVREARARIRAGALGALLTIQGAYLQDWLLT